MSGNIRTITLTPLSSPGKCPNCGSLCYKVHASPWREAFDAPLFPGERLKLRFQVLRYRCSCGRTFTVSPSFIEPRAKVTNAMVLFAQLLMRMPSLTLFNVHELTGLSCPTLKKFDKEQLKFCYENINLTGVQNIAIDEFSIFKGHRYATVVIDNDTCRVLWVGKGKSRKCVQPFFDMLKERGFAGNILSVACDQNAAYPSLVRENLPNAVIVYDLFHVMKHWREDVLIKAKTKTQQQVAERIKKELQQTAQNEGKAVTQQTIKTAVSKALKPLTGADWILLSTTEKQKPKKRADYQKKLDTMLSDNKLLASLYPIAESIRNLWTEKSVTEADKKLKAIRSALLEINRRHDFKPAKQFAMMLSRRQDGILEAGRFGFTTNRLEGVNNRIKTLKRTAFGYRDMSYFFLKIKATLPGKGSTSMYTQLADNAVIQGQCWQGSWTERQ